MLLVGSFIKGSDEIIFFARTFFNVLYIYWNYKWCIKLCCTTGKTDKDSDDEIGDEDEDEDENETDNDISDDASEDLDDDAADDDLQDLSDIDLADVDDDLSDMEFNGSEDEENVDDELTSNLNKKLNKGPKSKKKKEIDNNIFVSVEKFAEMLEEQNKTRGKHGGSNVFSSSDGASAKQIDWEMKRHQRMKGFGKKKRKSVQTLDNNRVKRFKR